MTRTKCAGMRAVAVLPSELWTFLEDEARREVTKNENERLSNNRLIPEQYGNKD